MEIKYLEFKQNQQSFLLAAMPFESIDRYAQVLVYGDSAEGYQRKPEPKHFNKIRDYITDNLSEFILPTSIVLGVDKEDLSSLTTVKNGNNIISLGGLKKDNKLLRIVDGQHRIYGLREAAKTNPGIKDFLLPVIILVTNKNKRSIELSIFNDINSKAKRVKVDLIELAKYNYRLREKSISEKNIIEHICIKTAFVLKEEREFSVWHNAIKFDIHNELILGIVGVRSFMDSIQLLAKTYLKEHKLSLPSKDYEALLNYVDTAGNSLSEIVFTCWDSYIKSKWPDAFDSKQIGSDIDEELRDYYYKKDYYIQKTFGVKAINGIIGDLFKDNKGVSSKTLTAVKTRIANSKVTNNDWKVGGKFSGFSSESGVNKVKKLI